MNKIGKRTVGALVGLAMAAGIGVALGSTASRRATSVEAAAGDEITFTINISNVTAAGATWPTSYSTTQTTWSQTVSGVTVGFAVANFTTGTGTNAGTMQNRVNNAGCSYLVNTSLTPGYAIKSVQGTSSTARNWDFYGATSTISVSNDNPAVVTGGTKIGNTVTNNALVSFGSGTPYDSTNYPYTHFAMVRTGSNAGYYTAFTVKVVQLASTQSTMIVKNSSGDQTPFSMDYGNVGGMLFSAYESNGTDKITSGVTWSVSNPNVLTLETDYADNHCWVVAGQPGEATLTATKSGYTSVVSTITVNKGDLSGISVSGSMTKTDYKVGDNWDPSGFVVTATYSTGFEENVTGEAEWSYNPATATSTSVTSVIATASFGGETDASDAQSVTVTEGVTYDLSKITGFSGWTTAYGAHDLTEASFNPAVGTAASLNFLITNKQSSGTVGTTYPCIGAKTASETTCLTFTLNASGKKITSVDITFVTRYTDTYPSLYLHKGSGIATTPLSSLTMSGNQASEHTLSCANLNDTVFTVGYNAHQTGSNGAVGIKSISIGLADQASFGTLDHISVSGLPNTIYHVGEEYDATGFAVTAYDGADEATANFKDVTASVVSDLEDGYVFVDGDVPGFDCEVAYTGDGGSDTTSFHVDVYALAQYKLVTEEPADWSGSYLIVGTDSNSDMGAMNGALANPDVESGYKVVTADGENVIEAGQELEWTIASYSTGYSIRGKSGKYIGSLSPDKANGMLVSDSPLLNSLSYGDGATTITGTNTYHLQLNTAGNRFRYYSSGTVQLYKLVESDNADAYAQTFLGAFTCTASGTSKPSFALKEAPSTYWTWALLASEYNGLTASEKEQFRLGVASTSGDNIAQALARYDYIVGKYFKTGVDTSFTDFMARDPKMIGEPKGALSTLANNVGSVTSAFAAVSVVGLAAVGGLVFLRKRKEF